MSSGAPTLINLPPPPSDPATPSEIPGTPNSSTTVMSELSTVAIKDGHHGHAHHQGRLRQQLASVAGDAASMDAERADRISRLAGLERLSAVRQSSNTSLPAGASAAHPQGYFDAPGGHSMAKERSTVGSASATGSLGGRTNWASGSDAGDTADKMSEDQDMETSSTDGLSEEGNGSLVGFGEGASSTVSGPISTGVPAARGAPQRQSRSGVMPMTGVVSTAPRDPRHVDGMTYDHGVTDTTAAPPGQGTEVAEAIMSDGFDDHAHRGERLGQGTERRPLGSFSFEDRK